MRRDGVTAAKPRGAQRSVQGLRGLLLHDNVSGLDCGRYLPRRVRERSCSAAHWQPVHNCSMRAGRWPARWLVSLILLGLAPAAPRVVHAQQIMDARVGVGTPLQVGTVTDTTRSGTFLSQSDSALVVQESCGSGCARVARIPWTAVTHVDAAMRHRSTSVARAVRGGAIGTAFSLTLAYAAARLLPCRREGGARCPGFGPVLFVPAMVSVGGAVGAAAGWYATDERWEPVWADGGATIPR